MCELQQRWPCKAERLPSIALSGGGTKVLVGLLAGELNQLLLLLLVLQDAHSDITAVDPVILSFPCLTQRNWGKRSTSGSYFPTFTLVKLLGSERCLLRPWLQAELSRPGQSLLWLPGDRRLAMTV